MMLKTLGKRFAAVAMAVSMAMGGFAAYAPAATVEAANDQNTLTQPTIQENNVVVGEDGKVYVRFKWSLVNEADKYECQICYDYSKKNDVTQFNPLKMTEDLFVLVEVPETYNNIALRVAARNGSKTSGFTEPKVIAKNKVTPYVTAQKNFLEAQDGKTSVLVDKAKALAKQDKKKGAKCYYGLLDINGDGTDELLYVNKKGGNTVSVYSISGKNVKLAKTFKKVSAVYTKGKTVSFVTNKGISTCKLSKKGKLTVTASYSKSAKTYKKNLKKIKKQVKVLYDYTKL